MSGDNVTFNDFDYVLGIQKGAKICFGSAVGRNTDLIGKGLAPHQKQIMPELFIKTGPAYYETAKHTDAYSSSFKKRSKAGIPGIANKAPRFESSLKYSTPSPGRYKISKDWSCIKKSKAPFDTKSVGKKLKVNDSPGPTMYNANNMVEWRKTKSMFNFGKPELINAVETTCVTIPSDSCLKCKELCDGDYWQKDYTLFLCLTCREEEKRTQEILSETELKQYKKIRNCSFMHNHERTNAAIRILPQNKIKKKIRLENYLDLYFTCS